MHQEKRSRAQPVGFAVALVGALSIPAGGPQAAVPTVADASDSLRNAVASRSGGPLEKILPSSGRIRVDLPTLAADASGMFSPSQFTYLLEDIYRRHVTLALRLADPPAGDDEEVSLRASLAVEDAAGRRSTVGLRVVFTHDADGWVLREFGEHARSRP